MSRPKRIHVLRHGAPAHRMVSAWRWAWTVRDGMTGPVVAEGVTRTGWGARRRIERTLARCVRLTALPRVCRGDRPVLHPLSRMEAYELSCRLELADIPVTVRVDGPGDGAVVLWPALALTTAQEVRTLHAVLDVTDAPVRWAGGRVVLTWLDIAIAAFGEPRIAFPEPTRTGRRCWAWFVDGHNFHIAIDVEGTRVRTRAGSPGRLAELRGDAEPSDADLRSLCSYAWPGYREAVVPC